MRLASQQRRIFSYHNKVAEPVTLAEISVRLDPGADDRPLDPFNMAFRPTALVSSS
jgi:hypothetical protein